ncbi:MAG: oligoendopeptidase F [Bacilli bacterium]|nr:oligoendopeptidase F [Bacilli bacterium]
MERNKIDDKYKWKLEDLYSTIEDYNKDIEKLSKLVEELVTYKGKVTKDSKTLLEVLLLNEKIDMITNKLYVFINMRLHEDTRVGKYQELSGNLDIILSVINEKTSFFIPELLECDYNKIKEYISDNKDLKRFEFLLEMIFNEKDHILSKEIEEVLSRTGNILSTPDNVFSNLNDADLVFDYIKDEKGKKVRLTKGNYYPFTTSKDRKVRKSAFNTLYKKYKELNNTFASILNSNLQTSTFLTKTRKYDSPINLYLDSNKIDTNIYYDLIKSVNSNLDKMKNYIDLKKKELKLSSIHMYDMAVKLSDEEDSNYTFNEAKELVSKALSVLGDNYIKDLNNGFNSGWIDVYENDGKRSGAYSWGCYNAHPYVLLNYQGKYNDVSTLAHEMGHAMHRFYSNRSQDYFYSDNQIFVAEIASTVNETLLNLYMLKNGDNKLKKSIINEMLDDIKNTIFRQTMFAEFELDIHNRCFNGETLNGEKLNNIYYDLVKKYHKGAVVDTDIKYEWSRIPHFYTPFYVYQYATGLSIAIAIATKISNGDKDMLDKYLKFLSSGSNDYPTNLVEKMGINISDAVNEALRLFDKLIKEYKN